MDVEEVVPGERTTVEMVDGDYVELADPVAGR